MNSHPVHGIKECIGLRMPTGSDVDRREWTQYLWARVTNTLQSTSARIPGSIKPASCFSFCVSLSLHLMDGQAVFRTGCMFPQSSDWQTVLTARLCYLDITCLAVLPRVSTSPLRRPPPPSNQTPADSGAFLSPATPVTLPKKVRAIKRKNDL